MKLWLNKGWIDYFSPQLYWPINRIPSVRSETHPNVVTIVPRSEWKANDPRPYKQHVPVRITVHHEGGKVLEASEDGGQRLKNIQTWCMDTDRNWTDVPYHYLIAADGTIYEGWNVNTVGEPIQNMIPQGIC